MFGNPLVDKKWEDIADVLRVFNNGVPFDPSGPSWNGDGASGWQFEVLCPAAAVALGIDVNRAHTQGRGMYHYHVEPLFLTQSRGKSGLLGFLLDGYPLYGPVENGKTLVSADLDEFHGHSHATAEYPNGVYHYHVTADVPYINGSGFKGNPGTVSQ